jgi:hypothetical protein
MIEHFFMATSVPLGLILAKVTGWEKNIYCKQQYFPTMIWVFAILFAVFIFVDRAIGYTFLFMFLMTFTWLKVSERVKK